MANASVKDDLQVPLSQVQDSENACYQDAIASQAVTEKDDLVDLSDCVSNLTTQDKQDLKDIVLSSFEKFFIRHDIKTPDGIIQIVHSMTYGEMLICLLLFTILIVMVVKWFWEVLRY